MALTLIASASGVNTATMPAHQIGDLLLVFAYRDGNTTAPTAVTGYTTKANSGANANSSRLGSRVATATNHTTGTWTNATGVIVQVWRPSSGSMIALGAVSAAGGAANGNVSYPTVALEDTSGSSVVVAFAGHTAVNTALETAPTGMTNRVDYLDSVNEVVAHSSTASGVTSWPTTSVTQGGTAAAWRSYCVEIKEVGPISASASITDPIETVSGTGRDPSLVVPAVIVTALTTEYGDIYPGQTITSTVNIGAAADDRQIVGVMFSQSPETGFITSASINGVTAQVAAAPTVSEGWRTNIIRASVPAGSGVVPFVVNTDNYLSNYSIHWYRVDGAEPIVTGAAEENNSSNGGNIAITLTVPAKGAIIAGFARWNENVPMHDFTYSRSTDGSILYATSGYFTPTVSTSKVVTGDYTSYDTGSLAAIVFTPIPAETLPAGGAASITDPIETITASGTLAIAGVGAVVDGLETVAGSGLLTALPSGIVGVGAVTDGLETVAGSGALAIAASGSILDGLDLVSASGSLAIAGYGVVSDQLETVSATGTLPILAIGSAADGLEVVAGSGSVAISGSGAIIDGGEAVAGTGKLALSAVGSATDGIETVAGVGALALSAIGSAVDGLETVAGSGSIAIAGVGSISDQIEAVSGSGALAITGSASITDPLEIVSGSSAVAPPAGSTASITDGLETISASGSLSIAAIGTIVDGDSVSAMGTLSIAASASITDGAEIVAGSGAISIMAIGSILDGIETVSGSSSHAIAAAASFVDGLEIVVGSGVVLLMGSASIDDGLESVSAFGSVQISASGSIDDGLEIVNGSGVVQIAGVGEILDLGETVDGFAALLIRGATEALDGLEAIEALGSRTLPISGTGDVLDGIELVSGVGRILPRLIIEGWVDGPTVIEGFVSDGIVVRGYLASEVEIVGYVSQITIRGAVNGPAIITGLVE